ncbi:hypothetical protein ACWQ06_01120 [Streptomyces angustmyceticus]
MKTAHSVGVAVAALAVVAGAGTAQADVQGGPQPHGGSQVRSGAALRGVTAPQESAPKAVTVKAATGPYKILKTLKYSGPGNMPLRNGYYKVRNGKQSGFGWTKIKKKHAITKYGAIEFITKGPNRKHQGGKSYKQWAYAGKFVNGRLVKQYRVLVSVQESIKHSGRDHKPKGVITAYCEGITRCPAWVSVTLAKQNQGIAPQTAPQGGTFRASYASLPKSIPAAPARAAVANDTVSYHGSYRSLR